MNGCMYVIVVRFTRYDQKCSLNALNFSNSVMKCKQKIYLEFHRLKKKTNLWLYTCKYFNRFKREMFSNFYFLI